MKKPKARKLNKRRRGGLGVAKLAGWREFVNLPELEIGPIPAKADTGAMSAALHAENIVVHSVDGARRVRFDAFIDEARHITRACDLPLHGVKRVKSSTGTVEDRWVVETEIELGQTRWRALVTLTDRNEMGLPMLLGRATLRGRFVVHPGRSFLLTRSVQRSALRRTAS
jgi:hypothetical protein